MLFVSAGGSRFRSIIGDLGVDDDVAGFGLISGCHRLGFCRMLRFDEARESRSAKESESCDTAADSSNGEGRSGEETGSACSGANDESQGDVHDEFESFAVHSELFLSVVVGGLC